MDNDDKVASILASFFFLKAHHLIQFLGIPDTPGNAALIFSLFQYGLEIYSSASNDLCKRVINEFSTILIHSGCSKSQALKLTSAIHAYSLLFMEAESPGYIILLAIVRSQGGFYMFVTDRIRELLNENNQSINQMAKSIGIGSGTFATWESNHRTPTGDVLSKIADYFDVSVDYLLYRTDIPQFGRPTDGWCGDHLSEIRGQTGETPEKVATAVGISTLNYLEYERSQADPPLSVLCRLADHFCVNMDWLMGRSCGIYVDNKVVTGEFRVTEDEKQLIEQFRLLSDDIKRGKILGHLEAMLSAQGDSADDTQETTLQTLA